MLIASFSHAYNLPFESMFKAPSAVFLLVYSCIRVIRIDIWLILVAAFTVIIGWSGLLILSLLTGADVTASYVEFGVGTTLQGHIRLDGSKLDQFTAHQIGQFVGYLPQDIQLFDGTISENIARFTKDAEPKSIIEAAKIVGVHDMITALPDGYNTVIGLSGFGLSSGQQQRIALARALFGNPFLIVLDEPNSNLNSEGESALTDSIKTMRDRGSIVIVIAHRPSAIAAVNKILCMNDGKQAAFGPKDDILKQIIAPVKTQDNRKFGQ
jgi:ABC-type protease/lipase transport system fused ATPase/permease subunit